MITFNTFACILLQRKNSVFFAFNYYWIKKMTYLFHAYQSVFIKAT